MLKKEFTKCIRRICNWPLMCCQSVWTMAMLISMKWKTAQSKCRMKTAFNSLHLPIFDTDAAQIVFSAVALHLSQLWRSFMPAKLKTIHGLTPSVACDLDAADVIQSSQLMIERWKFCITIESKATKNTTQIVIYFLIFFFAFQEATIVFIIKIFHRI